MPYNKQFFFQDPATPYAVKLISLHDDIMFYLVFIVFFVFSILYNIFIFYNSKSNYSGVYSLITYNISLEIFWTVLPALLLLLIIWPSFMLLYNSELFMLPNYTLKIYGNQWYWTYEKFNDLEQTNFRFDSLVVDESKLYCGEFRLLTVDKNLKLPVKTHIRLLITSNDVLHSWTIPSFGIKLDACPGRLNQVGFYSARIGTFYGQCSEICGVQHSAMPICVSIKSKDFMEHLRVSVAKFHKLRPRYYFFFD